MTESEGEMWGHRQRAISVLPNLQVLDGIQIISNERANALGEDPTSESDENDESDEEKDDITSTREIFVAPQITPEADLNGYIKDLRTKLASVEERKKKLAAMLDRSVAFTNVRIGEDERSIETQSQNESEGSTEDILKMREERLQRRREAERQLAELYERTLSTSGPLDQGFN